MGMVQKEGKKVTFIYPERVVIDKKKIEEYLSNGASIYVSGMSAINITLA